MADIPGDDDKDELAKARRKLRVVPPGRAADVDPTNEITLESLLKEGGPGEVEDSEEVFVRRIDRKLAAREKSDFPWLRRFVGLLVIGAAFYYGWQSLNRKSEEIIRRKTEAAAKAGVTLTPDDETPEIVGSAPAPQAPPPLMAARLDVSTLETISECTKGVNAFRLLSLRPKAGESATLETVFKPVFDSTTRKQLNLHNVRIRISTGEEWRLHASPTGQKGDLGFKLFRVAGDGLPEQIEFPDDLKDLAEAKFSDAAIKRFLAYSVTPGFALEVERHEAWSYPGKAGAQVIWSDDHIFDIQAFMPGKFLACSRGVRAEQPTINCKCVEQKR